MFDLNDTSSDEEVAPAGSPAAEPMGLGYTSDEEEKVVAAASISTNPTVTAETGGAGAEDKAAQEETEITATGVVVAQVQPDAAAHVAMEAWCPPQHRPTTPSAEAGSLFSSQGEPSEAAGSGGQDAEGRVRVCGTPGCSLSDFHTRACESQGVLGKRKR
jgi:hypothetical protein